MTHFLIARRVAIATAALFLLLAQHSALGIVVGTATDNGNGTTTYSYTINNTGLTEISGFSLEFDFPVADWDQQEKPNGDVDVPAGWFADVGSPIPGKLLAQFFTSGDPSSDVQPGKTLGGFSFISAFAPGDVIFRESPQGGGTTVGPVTARVPETGNHLMILGLAALTVVGFNVQSRRCAT